MLARLSTWLDHRTGCHRLIKAVLLEPIPGGARWRYVWGSCLAFVFALQLLTGVLLMTAYSPSASTAWSSVYFIQYEMDFGWFIRGLHHFGSQAMVVLLGVHLLQVVIAGAQLPPREVNWWLGLALAGAVLGLSLTGYLLPWDQKGYWATQVATNMVGNLPLLGPGLQKILIGGPVYGHHTLTRFFTLHVAVLPGLMLALLLAHVAIFRRHGVTTPAHASGQGWFWPDQAFRDLLVSLLIFAILLALVLWGHAPKIEPADPGGAEPAEGAADRSPSLYEWCARAGRHGCGAGLDAPADPARPYPARPEWYFLFLFQLLKYFEGKQELLGTVVIPPAAGLLLALLPLLGYGRGRPVGRVLGVLIVVGFLTGVAVLTCLAIADDMLYPPARLVLVNIASRALPGLALLFLLHLGLLALLGQKGVRKAVHATGAGVLALLVLGTSVLAYESMKTDERFAAHRRSGSETPFSPGIVLAWGEKTLTAEERAPRQGVEKLRDELDQAARLARRAVQLAGAGIPADGALSLLHRDPWTRGKELFGQYCATCHSHGRDFENNNPAASDLAGFGTPEWIGGLLRQPESPRYFGNTKLRTMSTWVKKTRARARKEHEEAKLDADFDVIARWLGSHPVRDPPGQEQESDASPFAQGYRAFADRCGQCHTYKHTGGGDARGPDLTGYGNAAWLRLMIMAPYHALRYGTRNRMPAFRDLEGVTSPVTRAEVRQIRELLLKEQLLAGKIKEEDPQAGKWKQEIEAATRLVHLSNLDRELIIRWLLHDYRVVFVTD